MSSDKIENDIRENFEDFFVLAFHQTHPDTPLQFAPYLEYMCARFQRLKPGARVVFNLPARALKSWTTKFYVAWFLGRRPSAEVIILSNTQRLAEMISYDLREILRAPWYRRIFPAVKISPDRASVGYFKTTAGGAVFASSVESTVAGFGAHLMILDDPNKPDDAENSEKLGAINRKFEGEILSRLNNPLKAIVVVVQHRIAADDVSGHAIEAGYKRIALPLIAPKNKTFKLLDGKSWVRKRGDVLAPGRYNEKEIKRAMNTVSPSAFYYVQQGVGNVKQLPIRLNDFSFQTRPVYMGPAVISIDAAQRSTDSSSFSVIQTWRQTWSTFHLVEQFRKRCELPELERAAISVIKRHAPAAVLVENAALGSALISRLRLAFPDLNLIAIEPKGSKHERLERHRRAIRRGVVSLDSSLSDPASFAWEFVEFPKNGSDQVDAATQYFDFMATKPHLRARESRSSGAIAFASRPSLNIPRTPVRGIAVAYGSRLKKRFDW